MDAKVKIQIIKSVTAIICAAGVCFGASKISDNVCASNLDISSSRSSVGETDDFFSFDGEGDLTEDSAEQSGDVSEDSVQQQAEDVPDAGTEDIQTGAEAASPAPQTEKPSANDAQTPAQSAGEKSGVPSSKAEIINYCNNALNSAKAAKPGFTKKYVMDPKGPSQGVVKYVVGLVTKDETKTIKKGSDITDEFPAAGYSWSSKLREQDVAGATLTQKGQYYDITLRLVKETNPSKGEASSYGRVMSVIDAKDAENMVPGIKNVRMFYHDGYVHAIVDSKTGRVVKAEFSATADVSANLPVFGDVAINNIVSTETFTDFVY